MKSFVTGALLCCTLLAANTSSSFAQSKPSPEAAKSFLDFYYLGQGKGVILADIKVCTDVVNTECEETVDPSLLKAGESYKIWMAFVVPEGDVVETLNIQFSQNDELQFSRDLSVKGSIRYRTWRTFTPNNAGIWEVKVMDNREVELEELAKLSLVVSQE